MQSRNTKIPIIGNILKNNMTWSSVGRGNPVLLNKNIIPAGIANNNIDITLLFSIPYLYTKVIKIDENIFISKYIVNDAIKNSLTGISVFGKIKK